MVSIRKIKIFSHNAANGHFGMMLFYKADKSFISQIDSGKSEFKTPANAAFFRYNFSTKINHFDFYVYKVPETVTSTDLNVMLSSNNLADAQPVDVQLTSGNMFSGVASFLNALDANCNPIWNSDDKAWRHTEFIECEPSAAYTTNMVQVKPQFWFYDAERRPISYNGIGNNASVPFGDFTTPINAFYMKANILGLNPDFFYLRPSSQNTVMLRNLVIFESNVIADIVYNN